MKRFLRPIYAGISGTKSDSKWIMNVDFEDNSDNDIVQFLKPYRTKLEDNVYWFGYKYNEGIKDKELYQTFIEFIKNVEEDDSVDYISDKEGIHVPHSPNHITESEVDSMIIRALDGIGISKYNIDSVVYPGSSKHNLVQVMIKCIKRYLRKSDKITYTQLTKLASSEVELDRKQFVDDLYNDNDDLEGMSIDTIYQLQQELKNKGNKLFSIREDIHPQQLRRYVKQMFENESSEALVNAHNVLVVDDFKTSGTTLLEIVDMIEQVNDNDDLTIYLFTLMGNFRK